MIAHARRAPSWVLGPFDDPQRSLRLLCFPFAGGGSVTFRDWPRRLPAELAVCPVALPGRELRGGEPALRRMPALIDSLIEALSERLGPRYALFGHSMGALLAFEFARAMRRLGKPEPLLLAVSGRRAPTLLDPAPRLHDRPDGELLDHLQRLGRTPQRVLQEPGLMQLLLPTIRADFELLETWRYEPEPPLGCPIHAWFGEADTLAPGAAVERWRDLTCGRFALHALPGDHFFVESAGPQLLAQLAGALME
jgi:medium-chain acyl-[acyl-carrier-protein] hydrolase